MAKTKTIKLHTSAPEAYDGFGTKTLRIAGTDVKNGNPVREIRVEGQHYDWQTSRYASGNYPYTNEWVNFPDYVSYGDWTEDTGATPEVEPKGGRAPIYVTRLREDLDRVTQERDAMEAKVRELLAYVGSDKFKNNEYVHVGDVVNRLR